MKESKEEEQCLLLFQIGLCNSHKVDICPPGSGEGVGVLFFFQGTLLHTVRFFSCVLMLQ